MLVYDYSDFTRDQLLAEVYRLNLTLAIACFQFASSDEEKKLYEQQMQTWLDKGREQLQKIRESH